MISEKEIDTVIEVCNRLNPMIHRFLIKLVKDHGEDVAMSVMCNLSTSMSAQAMLIAHALGGDEQAMLDVMNNEAQDRFRTLLGTAESLLARAMFNSTCSPIKH